MSIKRLLAAAVAAGLALGLAACSSGGGSGDAKATQTLHIGYIGDFSGSGVFAVAEKQGLFAKEGLKADLKVFTNGPLQIQALASKDLDIGYIGPGALWLPASGKAKIIGINQLGYADHVIAQPGKGITSIADLKGKKVAVPQGTSGEMVLRLALKKAGMSISDLNVVNMDPSTAVSAFASGSVDAAAIWYPLIDTIKKKTPNFVDLASDKAFYPQVTFPNMYVAGNNFVTQHADLVKKYLKVVQEANDWINSHTADAVKIDADFLKMPASQLAGVTDYVKLLPSSQLVADSKNGTVDKWLDGLAQVFVEMGQLKSAGSAKDYYTSDLYVAAAGS